MMIEIYFEQGKGYDEINPMTFCIHERNAGKFIHAFMTYDCKGDIEKIVLTTTLESDDD
jgi:hypothetical protein